MTIDILAIGAHADDIEIGVGGTLLKHRLQGRTIALCDLTLAELSSNGDVETRLREAEAARQTLGAEQRIQLELGDRQLRVSDEQIRAIVAVIRQLRPKLIFAPFWKDRHPDHEHASRLVREAAFSAGIRHYAPETGAAHRPQSVFYYFINDFVEPDFCVDVTNVYEQKMDALECYQSQFLPSDGTVVTPLNSGYFEQIRSREYLFGRKIGTGFAEGFKTNTTLALDYLV
ncbi:bacillithiol biosynthesis deacetylase BshB1 [Ammoniphilus oxalaticus]|uniref:Bacillithiol biosynthesis deacetylase BshB1 n=1 Tax=Ammoniphilus oxalaticus TaxID=66863 RepID=A0A419SNB3_9BACL|nr:bacillithiol biosynthesis deacetylase BshB1 [Ammoniphilus oxalaticus]RKD25743.1 bacillithiol biosynthesis deacetylase BshB1 [Ammoniphilus oxalaticus]